MFMSRSICFVRSIFIILVASDCKFRFYLMTEIIVYIVLRENIVMDGDTVTFNVTSVERLFLDHNPM